METIRGGSLTIRRSPLTTVVSFEKARMLSLVRALAISASTGASCLAVNCRRSSASSRSTSRWWYQTFRLGAPARLSIAFRYSPMVAARIRRRSLRGQPHSRAPTAKLAARRFTSHSQGPGCVSSKSLMSKTNLRSGVPKMPKFERCASPQSWVWKPESGVAERSAAMIAAAPRKKANGDTSIRPWRIGTSSGMRVAACSSRTVTGSGRVADGSQSAWARLGVVFRAALPSAARSAGETYS